MYINTDSSVRDAVTANRTKIPYNQVIQDIYHGMKYRELQEFTEQGNLTLLMVSHFSSRLQCPYGQYGQS